MINSTQIMCAVKMQNLVTKILRTSFGDFPSTLIPLTSMTSSPHDIRPSKRDASKSSTFLFF